MQIAEKLKKIRKERGFTQKRLAEKAGLAEVTIRQYESGKREPKFKMVEKLAKALEISAAELTGDYSPSADLPEQIQKQLNRYREIYDEWQQYIQERYNAPFLELLDNTLLMIALDEAIAAMHLLMAENRREVK